MATCQGGGRTYSTLRERVPGKQGREGERGRERETQKERERERKREKEREEKN